MHDSVTSPSKPITKGEEMKYTLLKNKITGARAIYVAGQGKITEAENPEEYTKLRKLALNNIKISSRNDALRSLGLKRVTGALGGVYWE
jgi:hypothetical protein